MEVRPDSCRDRVYAQNNKAARYPSQSPLTFLNTLCEAQGIFTKSNIKVSQCCAQLQHPLQPMLLLRSRRADSRDFGLSNLDAAFETPRLGHDGHTPTLRPSTVPAGSHSTSEDGPNTRLRARLQKSEASLDERASARVSQTTPSTPQSALHWSSTPPTVLSQRARAPQAASSPSSKPRSTRKVAFAFGPLQDTPDGHPCPSQAGRPMPRSRARLDMPHVAFCSVLHKKEVLQLEQLLGEEYASSITKLKRRVNLLPTLYTLRPYATVGLT